jgi:hypothetical protein
MTLNEKIERMRELLAQRDEIERELGGLLGGDEIASSAAQRNTQKPTKTKETKTKAAKTHSGKRTVTCKKCGKTGHIAKTCTAPAAAAPTFGDKHLLDEDQFDALKHLQSIGDLISKDFAIDHGLPLAQVNRAIACRNFEEYLNF